MESAQISGKVFRFLSTMHPALSKPERKRYAEFDPEKWYAWTPDIAGEFTDLMRRSPRDTSFARGLAYAATKGLPEDSRLSPTDVVAGLATLPAAFHDLTGSGFEVQMERPGHAAVYYRGMPGFSNVCIAIAGELTQRLQAVGARGLDVRHGEGCRQQGNDACRFEVRWSAEAGESVAAASSPAADSGESYASSTRASEELSRFESSRGQYPPAARSQPARTVAARPAPPPVPAASSSGSGNPSDDLFEQLRTRLADAERQTARHAELEAHIAALDAHTAELEAALADAEAEAQAARDALADLKHRLRELVG